MLHGKKVNLLLEHESSDQNSSHRQRHEFVTETQEYEFVRVSNSSSHKEKSYKCYKYDINM